MAKPPARSGHVEVEIEPYSHNDMSGSYAEAQRLRGQDGFREARPFQWFDARQSVMPCRSISAVIGNCRVVIVKPCH